MKLVSRSFARPMLWSGKKAKAGLLSLALLAGFLVVGNPADAVHTVNFELEGNTAPASGTDWGSLFNADTTAKTPPTGYSAATFEPDSGPDASAFTGGSKDSLAVSSWDCKNLAKNIGGKFDILNAYSVAYRNAANELIIYSGVERSSNNGNANVGVWYLQDPSVNCENPGNGPLGFTGSHVTGDVFVVSEFTDGGTISGVNAYKWVGNDSGALDPTPIATGVDCKSLGANAVHKVCATVNTAPLSTPWATPDSTGGDLDERQFFEVGINLTQALGGAPCFATFLADSRSSQELGSTVHDFARASFPVCNPSTKLTMKATAQITYTFYELNDGDAALSNPSVTSNNCDATPAYVSGDAGTSPNGKLDPGETWVFTCVRTLTGPTADTGTESQTNAGVGHGTFDNKDVTFCSAADATKFCKTNERDRVKVTIENLANGADPPPPAP